VLAEFNMRVANNPDARLSEQMMAALYLIIPTPPHHRLASGDREAQPRGRAGVLQTLLRAEQRDPGDCRRRHAKEVRPMVGAGLWRDSGQPAIAAQRPPSAEPEPAAPRP